MPEPYKFRAFISYSHGDEEFVRSFHRALEAYRAPKPLVGEVTRRSARSPAGWGGCSVIATSSPRRPI